MVAPSARIEVDGEACPVAWNPEERVSAFLARLQAVLARTGRIVVAVRVDGRDVPAEHLPALLDSAMEEAGAMALETAPRLVVAATTLRGLENTLGALRARHDQVVAALQAGQSGQGMGLLSGALDLWQSAQQAVLAVTRLLAADQQARFADLTDPEGELAEVTGDLVAVLRRMRDTLKAKDTTALCDRIEADLVPLVERWEGLIGTLADRVDAARDDTEP